MKNKIAVFLTLFTVILSLSFSNKKDTFSLTVSVNSLRNSNGKILVLLYNKEGSIPDKDRSHYFKKLSVKINNKSAVITFDDLPSDIYAINIIHDENDNGKIDMGFIKPKEGIGFSNFSKINLLNRPSFSKASFKINTDINIDVKTIYM